MYLSKLVLNPRHLQARRDLGNCHELHRTLLSAFPQAAYMEPGEPGARREFGLLYRLEEDRRTGVALILVQSRDEPDWSQLPAGYLATFTRSTNPSCKAVAERYTAIADSQVLRFRLRANPTKRCGKRGVLPGHRLALTSEAEQLAWLERKAAGAGFRLLQVETSVGAPHTLVPDVRADPSPRQRGWRTRADGERMPLVFGSVVFEGLLQVTDAERLRNAIAAGIGSGKAYGFGLLSIAPA